MYVCAAVRVAVVVVYAGGILVAGPWPTLIDVQHLSSSIEALRYSKLLPARTELLQRAEEERNADAALVRQSSFFFKIAVVVDPMHSSDADCYWAAD